jgi:hypothetical protein
MGNVYVAFLDILGFSEIIDKNTNEQLLVIYSEIEDIINAQLIKEFDEKRSIYDGVDIDIRFLIVSDSIIIWTSNDKPLSFCQLVFSVNELILSFFKIGLPLRGAISHGPISVVQNNTYTNVFGLSITKAYRTESIQNWAGCMVLRDCIKYVIDNTEYPHETSTHIISLFDFNILLEYEVPMKKGIVILHPTLNWSDGAKKLTREDIVNSFSKHNKDIRNWDVQTKIENTVKFFDYASNLPSPTF